MHEPRQKNSRITSEATAKQAGALYRGGKTVREVATAMECSYGAAHRLIEASGVPFRPRGGDVRSAKVRAAKKGRRT